MNSFILALCLLSPSTDAQPVSAPPAAHQELVTQDKLLGYWVVDTEATIAILKERIKNGEKDIVLKDGFKFSIQKMINENFNQVLDVESISKDEWVYSRGSKNIVKSSYKIESIEASLVKITKNNRSDKVIQFEFKNGKTHHFANGIEVVKKKITEEEAKQVILNADLFFKKQSGK